MLEPPLMSKVFGIRPSPTTAGGRQSIKAAGRIDREIGSLIRLRRMQVGMSQAKLGEALGITFQQIQKYERGTNRISVSRLSEIAQALGVDAGFFLPVRHGQGQNAVFVPTDRCSLELLCLFEELDSKSMRRAILMLVRSVHEQERTPSR